jgi:hypothetical protein
MLVAALSLWHPGEEGSSNGPGALVIVCFSAADRLQNVTRSQEGRLMTDEPIVLEVFSDYV